jgi:uncharacterized phage protein gp47/JayE
MLTLQQLINPVTEDEALETVLTMLGEAGLQTTSWQPGSVQLTILRLFSRVWARLTTTVGEIAAGGFTTLASSPFLTLLARHVYDLERLDPIPAVGRVTLTSSPGAPVHSWVAGDLIVSNLEEGADNAITYTITESGSLGPNQSLSFEFRADAAGSDANLPPAIPLFLWTPLVGVTATNPALAPDSNTWITTPGEDAESDSRLLARCIGRWARLTYGNTDGAYRGWALEALPALQRVTIASAPGDGTVTVIGATALGPITTEQAEEIKDYLDGTTDGIGRRPINDIVDVVPATAQADPPLTVTAYIVASEIDVAPSAIVQALQAYIGSIPIGGVRIQGTQGRVLFSELLCRAQEVAGVRSVSLSIAGDVLLADDEIYTPTISVVAHPVSPGVA